MHLNTQCAYSKIGMHIKLQLLGYQCLHGLLHVCHIIREKLSSENSELKYINSQVK